MLLSINKSSAAKVYSKRGSFWINNKMIYVERHSITNHDLYIVTFIYTCVLTTDMLSFMLFSLIFHQLDFVEYKNCIFFSALHVIKIYRRRVEWKRIPFSVYIHILKTTLLVDCQSVWYRFLPHVWKKDKGGSIVSLFNFWYSWFCEVGSMVSLISFI